MIKIDTLQVMNGHVPKEIIADIGIFAFLATLTCLAMLIIAIIDAIKRCLAYGFCLSILKTFIAVIAGYICLCGVFFFTSWGHTIPSLLPINNKLVTAEIDMNSQDFKALIENSANLKELIKDFPEKEQKHLDKKIVFKNNKCYFEILFNRKELRQLLEKNELKDTINSSLEGYIRTVQIYTK